MSSADYLLEILQKVSYPVISIRPYQSQKAFVKTVRQWSDPNERKPGIRFFLDYALFVSVTGTNKKHFYMLVIRYFFQTQFPF